MELTHPSVADTTIVNIALPTIGWDFKVSPMAVDAISIAFLVSLVVFIPASGCGVACSLSIRDADAAATIPARRGRRDVEPAAEPSAAA